LQEDTHTLGEFLYALELIQRFVGIIVLFIDAELLRHCRCQFDTHLMMLFRHVGVAYA